MGSFEQLLKTRLPAKRSILYGLGALILGAGVAALLAPLMLYVSVTTIVGVVLIGTGVLKAFQYLLGLRHGRTEERGFLLITVHVLLDMGLGVLLLNYQASLNQLLQWILVILIVVDGVVQLMIGLRAPHVASRWIFIALGFATLGIAAAVPFTPITLDQSIGLYVGIRLVLFGGALVLIATQAPAHDDPIYRSGRPDEVERQPGEAYAGYFGAAYHLGIYVGNEEVIHYTDQNVVSRVSWETFCKGRATQRWEYPDVERASLPVILETAARKVGEESKYDLFSNNCEHFVIYCLSGGRRRASRFAQIDASVSNLTSRPLLGPLLEVYARAIEKLAYDLGGMFGRRVALAVRRFTSIVTMWLVARSGSKTVSG